MLHVPGFICCPRDEGVQRGGLRGGGGPQQHHRRHSLRWSAERGPIVSQKVG